MVNIGEFLQWQWADYSARHQNRINLLLHIVAVPLFWFATIAAAYAALGLSVAALAASGISFMVSLVLQGRGHKRESQAPEPFASGMNFIARIFAEQWITFPRFVLSGGWLRNLTKG